MKSESKSRERKEFMQFLWWFWGVLLNESNKNKICERQQTWFDGLQTVSKWIQMGFVTFVCVRVCEFAWVALSLSLSLSLHRSCLCACAYDFEQSNSKHSCQMQVYTNTNTNTYAHHKVNSNGCAATEAEFELESPFLFLVELMAHAHTYIECCIPNVYHASLTLCFQTHTHTHAAHTIWEENASSNSNNSQQRRKQRFLTIRSI